MWEGSEAQHPWGQELLSSWEHGLELHFRHLRLWGWGPGAPRDSDGHRHLRSTKQVQGKATSPTRLLYASTLPERYQILFFFKSNEIRNHKMITCHMLTENTEKYIVC